MLLQFGEMRFYVLLQEHAVSRPLTPTEPITAPDHLRVHVTAFLSKISRWQISGKDLGREAPPNLVVPD